MTKPSDLIPDRTVYIVDGGSDYANWCQAREVDTMEEATFVLFTGGSDVSSSLYGKRKHPSAYYNEYRDEREVKAFKQAVALGKPILGICRGAQLAAVCSGGLLVQDQSSQGYLHLMETIGGQQIVVSSMHHQAMYPWGLPPESYDVIGWTVGLSDYHWGERDGEEMVTGVVPGDKECEIIHFKATRALAIQSHPESVFHDCERSARARESTDYMRSLLNRLITNTL